jgi:hypothetical protein
MAQEEYNGWTNYETWNVALWFDNDQGSHRMTARWVQDAYRNAKSDQHNTRKENAALALAETAKSFIEANKPLASQANCYVDLLQAALDKVSWREIAENWMEGFLEEEATEGEVSE